MSKSSLKVYIPFHIVLAEIEFERQRRRVRACRCRIHEHTISLRFPLSILLKVLRIEVPVWIS